MLYSDDAKILIGARKFMHDIGGKCEQRDKNKNYSPLDDTERTEDVSLAGTGKLNHGEVIWTHGMEKRINCVELCGYISCTLQTDAEAAVMQDFNRSSSHPDMATIRAVSAGDQSSNPSFGGWEMGSLSCPSKEESCVTSRGA
jgi:hypothetical protein